MSGYVKWDSSLDRPHKCAWPSGQDKEEDHISGESTASRIYTGECRAITATSDISLWKSNPETSSLFEDDGPSIPSLKEGEVVRRGQVSGT